MVLWWWFFFVGLHTISPEFCSENHSLTITNNNIVNRGIIYSPTYPEEYDSVSTRGNHCNVTISGLFESSWIRLKQSYVEKFSTSSRRTYQPCIEQDFIINNQSLPKNHYHCQIREGTLLTRQSITFQLNFAQRKMPPFTIEYTSKYLVFWFLRSFWKRAHLITSGCRFRKQKI